MTCGDFIGNLEGLNEGGDFPRELLKVGGGAGTGCWRGGVGDLLAPSEGSEVRGLPASCHRSLDSCDSAWGPTPSLEPHTPALSTCALACSGGCALRGRGGGSLKHVIRRPWTPYLPSSVPLQCSLRMGGTACMEVGGTGTPLPSTPFIPLPQGKQSQRPSWYHCAGGTRR